MRQFGLPLRRLALALVLLPVVADGLIDVERTVSSDSATDDVLLGEVAGGLHVLNRQVVRRKRADALAGLLELLLKRAHATHDAEGPLLHQVGPLVVYSSPQLLLGTPGRRERISAYRQVRRAQRHAVLIHPAQTSTH